MKKAVLIIAALAFAYLLLLCLWNGALSLLLLVFQAIWYLLAGWGYFILRKVPQANPSADAIITGMVALILLAGTLHWLMNRFIRRFGPAAAGERRWPIRATAAVLGVIVCAFAAGVAAIGITHQLIWTFTSNDPLVKSSGYGNPQAVSQNNMKQQTLAFHNNASAFAPPEAFPPAAIVSADGRLLHSWQMQLLPYLEQGQLYDKIDLNQSWNSPANREHFQTKLKVYLHPNIAMTHDENGYAISGYAANLRALSFETRTRLDQYPRGTSNTILIGEAGGNYKPWGHPLNVRDPSLGLQRSPDGFGGPRPGRTNFAMADGSVRTFTNEADPEFLEMMMNGRD